MAGKDVIAAMDARFAETNTNFAETRAMIESLGAELRIQRWLLGLLVAMVGMFMTVVVAIVLFLLPGRPAPTQVPVAVTVAEDLDPAVHLPATDPEDTAKQAAEEDAPQ